MPISRFLVLGGGSAGLMAAISLKRGFPDAHVRVVRSKEIGVIGVGEGTTLTLPWFLHEVLGLPQKTFFERARPTFKLGIRFLWGERKVFNYSFSTQLDLQWKDLPRPNGFYCHDDFTNVNLQSALMDRNKVFPVNDRGEMMHNAFGLAYHIENVKFVGYLEWQAEQLGVVITDDKMKQAGFDGQKITHLDLESGERVEADLFIDASGFRAELLGKVLNEEWVTFSDTLFCDRGVVGTREREKGEPIEPYTTAETYDNGWCWRIDHEDHINRGYVHCSKFISEEDAVAEYQRKNPKFSKIWIVKFRSGRFRRCWVSNVVAVGNAAGFVEPLEATALMVMCVQCRSLVQMLIDNELEPTPTMVRFHNEFMARHWEDTRNFLAIHYKYNTLLDTPFWRQCRADIPLHGLQPLLDFYSENGPSVLAKGIAVRQDNLFGLDGHYALLVGMKVPYKRVYKPSEIEKQRWEAHRREIAAAADRGVSIRQALDIIHKPDFVWKATARN